MSNHVKIGTQLYDNLDSECKENFIMTRKLKETFDLLMEGNMSTLDERWHRNTFDNRAVNWCFPGFKM